METQKTQNYLPLPGNYCCYKNHFKPVTHVIFDLDGTLLDSEAVYQEAFHSTAKHFGGEYTQECHDKILGTLEQDAINTIIKMLELDVSFEDFRQKFVDESYRRLADVGYMPGAQKLVKHLYDQEIPMAIATSSTAESVEIKRSLKKPFFDMFHHIVSGASDPEVLRGKPWPHVFIIAARRFPDRPRRDRCLVFEDAFTGLMGALSCGMQAVIIPSAPMSYSRWKHATLRLDSLKHFIPELFGIPPYGAPLPEKKPKEETTDVEEGAPEEKNEDC